MSARKIKPKKLTKQYQRDQFFRQQQAQYLALERVRNNPLPEGEEGLALLRSFSRCPIQEQSKELQVLLQTATNSEVLEEAVVDQILHDSTLAFLSAQKECRKQARKRTVCDFAKDESLQKLHQQIQELDKKAQELNTQLGNLVTQAGELLQQRWTKAVTSYGLNPEKYSYSIDEAEGIIEQVTLECATCKSQDTLAVALMSAHQALDAAEGKKND